MNLLVAWKKVLLFGAFGAVGCLAGWLIGEPYLLVVEAATPTSAGRAPSLISNTPASTEPPPPPREFQDRLKAAGAKSGDIQISLIWFNSNDLDLHCIDPSGFEICWRPAQRRSPRTGGELDVDRNAGCRATVVEPVENIYWPEGKAPMGRYRVYLNFYQKCPGAPSESAYKINVLHGGTRKEFSGTIASGETPEGGPMRLIYEFQVEPKLEVVAPNEFDIGVGSTLKIALGVRREFVPGKLEVKAEGLPAGVTAEPLTIDTGNTKGELVLKASDAAEIGKKKIKIVAKGEGVETSADADVSVVGRFSLMTVLAIGLWTALLAVGLCLALLAGQNKYLGKELFAPGRVPLALVILGAVAAGFGSGSIGQVLFFVFLSVGVGKLGFLVGWVLLGGLLGWGVSFFIPNLDGKKAALAGLGGGFLGAITFWIMSEVRDWTGRFGGAALLGFCIGLMVAVVEVAFRRAWLEVRFSEREVITVNLGPEPVKVGGDARSCTVWARGAAEVALRYWIRDGKVHCEVVPTRESSAVADGDTRTAGNVTVIVRTGGAPLPARPPIPTKPQAVPPALPARAAVPPIPAKPQAVPHTPAPAQSKPAQPDYDDGLPMPMGPPPPTRPAATSILDIDDVLAAAPRPASASPAPKPAPKPAAPAPPVPVVPKSTAPPAPKPPVPAAAKSMAPPVPVVPKSTAPPAPKPPAAGGTPKPGDPDACPTCGRKSHGKPGARYCMVCDKTF